MARAVSLCCRKAGWIALLLTAATGLFAQTNSNAAASLNLPDLATLRSQAAAGSSSAQAKLGDYHLAQGDSTNAFFWYRMAAENGDPQGQISLAACYFQGIGVPVNVQEAVKWQRMGILQRSHRSMVGRLAEQRLPVQRTAAGRIQTIQPVEPALEAARPGALQKPFSNPMIGRGMGRISALPPVEAELEEVQLQPRPAD